LTSDVLKTIRQNRARRSRQAQPCQHATTNISFRKSYTLNMCANLDLFCSVFRCERSTACKPLTFSGRTRH
jgi:hypothetical protein